MMFKNKRVILTSASSGIGMELLKLLLQADVKVVAASRSMEKSAIEHPGLFKVNCDVSSKSSLDNLFRYALEQLGGIDLFVANAGFAYFEKQSAPRWEHNRHIFDTNVLGLIYCAQKMKAINGDTPYNFVCTASVMSYLSMPGYTLYSSTKVAIRGYADAYRFEMNEDQYFQVAYPVSTKTSFFQTAGNNPPMAWPVLSAKKVARSIIREIELNRLEIYSSRLFRTMLVLNRYLPLIFPLYRHNEYLKFKNWLQQQSHGSSRKEHN